MVEFDLRQRSCPQLNRYHMKWAVMMIDHSEHVNLSEETFSSYLPASSFKYVALKVFFFLAISSSVG